MVESLNFFSESSVLVSASVLFERGNPNGICAHKSDMNMAEKTNKRALKVFKIPYKFAHNI